MNNEKQMFEMTVKDDTKNAELKDRPIDIIDNKCEKKDQEELSMKEERNTRVLFLLGLSTIFGMSTWFSASAVIPDLRIKWNVSDLEISMLTLSVNIGFLIGTLLSIYFAIADYYLPSNLMACGSILAAFFNLILIIPDVSLLAAIFTRLMTGASMAIVYPMASKVCCTWYLKRRGFGMGVVIACVVLGASVPSLINGTIKLDWQLVVVFTSVISVCGGLLSTFFLNEGPLYVKQKNTIRKNASFTIDEALHDAGNSNICFDVLRNKAFLLAVIGYSGHNWELYALWTWFTSYAYDAGIGDMFVLNDLDSSNGASFACFFMIFVGGIGSVVCGALADTYGRTTICIISLIFSVFSSLLLAWLNSTPGILFFIGLIWGMFSVSESAQYSSMVTEVVKPENIGTAATLQFAIGYIFSKFQMV
eukprot:g6382.t1